MTKTHRLARIGLAPLAALLSLSSPPAQSWEPLAQDLRNVRGVNYLATYPSLDANRPFGYFGVASSTAMWRFYDTAAGGTWQHVDAQLGWLKQAGINSVRVFLSYPAWEHYESLGTPSNALADKFEHFVGLCANHHIRVMPVLWDSHYLVDPTLGYSVEPNYNDPMGLLGAVGNPPQSNVRDWLTNPGPSRISTWVQQDPSLLTTQAFDYIADCVSAFQNNPQALLMWDIMNEPKIGLPDHPQFLASTLAILKGLSAGLTTFSWAVSDQVPASVDLALNQNLDVIGIHPYGNTRAMILAQVWDATHVRFDDGTLAPAKPVLCTELGNPGSAMSYRDALGFARNVARADLGPGQKGVGFMCWVSNIGSNVTDDRYPLKTLTGLFYGDGEVRETDAVMAFVDEAIHQGIPGAGLWTPATLTQKAASDPLYVAQAPVTEAWDDYWAIALLLQSSQTALENGMTWPLFLELHSVLRWSTGSVMVGRSGITSQNNGNPVSQQVFPWFVTGSLAQPSSDFAILTEYTSGAWIGHVAARHGYPQPGNPVFDPQNDPQDWDELGAEIYRWGQALRPYFLFQGGPY